MSNQMPQQNQTASPSRPSDRLGGPVNDAPARRQEMARAEYAALRYPGDLAADIDVAPGRVPWRRLLIAGVASLAAMVMLGTLTVGVVAYRLRHRPGPDLMPTAISLSVPSTGGVSLAGAPSLSGMTLSLDGLPSVSDAGVNLPSLPRLEPGPGHRVSPHRGQTRAAPKEQL